MRNRIAGMGDNGGERALKIEEQQKAMKALFRKKLRETILFIDDGYLAEYFAEYFVKHSQGNDTVQEVVLYLAEDRHRDYKLLRLLAEGFGNLGALRVVLIRFLPILVCIQNLVIRGAGVSIKHVCVKRRYRSTGRRSPVSCAEFRIISSFA
jgi:hypothetical protein